MNTYRITVTKTEYYGAVFHIYAEDEDEAKLKAEEKINNDGELDYEFLDTGDIVIDDVDLIEGIEEKNVPDIMDPDALQKFRKGKIKKEITMEQYADTYSELDNLISTVHNATENIRKRVEESGIDLEEPPLQKNEINVGEVLFDQTGNKWIVGRGRRMIPQFSKKGIQGVRPEIIAGREYPFSDIASWRRSKKNIKTEKKENIMKSCKCRKCGCKYEEGGDGWDGMCPNCADKAEAKKKNESTGTVAKITQRLKALKAEGHDMRETYKRLKTEFRNINDGWLKKYVRRNYILGERVAGMMGMKPLGKVAGATTQGRKPTAMDAYISELNKQENDLTPYSYAKSVEINPVRKQVKKAKMRSVAFMPGL